MNFMREQKLLFSIENFLDINPLENYQLLFNNLDLSPLNTLSHTGRKPVSKDALLKSFIYKNLRSIRSLTDIRQSLIDNPSAALRCSFDIRNPLPSLERFSSFIRDTDNKDLQKIRINLVHQLIELSIITYVQQQIL